MDARWQDDDQLHLTLRFVGEVDAAMADDVRLAAMDVRAAPFALRLDRMGVFGGKHGGHQLWAGVAPVDAVGDLHRKLDQALIRIGLSAEGRRYRPHITIARFRRESAQAAEFAVGHAALTSAAFTVSAFGLYESRLGTGGATYTLIQSYAMRT